MDSASPIEECIVGEQTVSPAQGHLPFPTMLRFKFTLAEPSFWTPNSALAGGRHHDAGVDVSSDRPGRVPTRYRYRPRATGEGRAA